MLNSSMRLKSIQAVLLSFPFPDPIRLPFYGGERTILKRDAMLIRVDTDLGLIGYAPGPGSEAVQRIIQDTVAPWLTGRTLADPDALRVQFENGPGKGQREISKAYCAVEVALWDLMGKGLGVPVSEMLGGRVRDRIWLYGSAGMYQSPEGYAEEAAAVQAMGYRGYKMRPGIGPDQDIRAVELMRKAVGDNYDLMVDAHTWWRMGDRSYSPETVARVAEAISQFDPLWLEEPLPPNDHAAYEKLHTLDLITLASGEHEPDLAGYEDLISTLAVEYIQMDVCCQGGFTMAQRLFSEISRAGLRFAFHAWGTDLEIAAAAQLGVCWPETVIEWLEYPCYSSPGKAGMYPFPLAQEILKEPLRIERGELVVSREPGLGVEIDERVIEKYPWLPGPWSIFQIHSPPQKLAVVGDHSVPWDAK